jgi:hypothetical protein
VKRSVLLASLTAAALALSVVQPAAADPAPGRQTQNDSGWALDRIDQTGPAQSPHQYTYGATGSGVDVYIVDSEIKHQPERVRRPGPGRLRRDRGRP